MSDCKSCALCMYYRVFGAGCLLDMEIKPCQHYYKRTYRKFQGRKNSHDEAVFEKELDRSQGWFDYDDEHYDDFSKGKR